ncbi:aspartate/glutamate racemase family protein [Bradyrhizobium sp. LHD-71]|uniref:aspartate/glutamate racemase family protein n=1 Tax=Bradyrhizobium sp. LHD-71 TaxID=3072141 RepID=UPI00280EE617|nr:aspartate/glutamate racemase family protein [Bradyrhizobium sp. LHD-71]MDQ8729199.1 aspartate/glutamate racemase family protein [Bradyrhizobium sp. LHD-71]
MPMRIWHQSFTVLEKLPAYAEALAAHFERIARPDTEVVLHGMHKDSYQTNYPGNDIQYAYFQTLHSQQFIVRALEAEESGFDAFAIMTLPEPSIEDVRAIVEIPVVGYCESAMLASALISRRCGVLLFIREMAPVIERNVQRIGLADRFIGAHDVGFTFNDVLAAYDAPGRLVDLFKDTARKLIARGADAIIPGEAPLCVLLARLGITDVDGVPIIDALGATIKMAEMSVDLRRAGGFKPAKTGYFSAKPPRERVLELLDFYGVRKTVLDDLSPQRLRRNA